MSAPWHATNGRRPARVRRGEAADQLGRDERQVGGADQDRAPVGQRQRLDDPDQRVARRVGLDPDRHPGQPRQLRVGLGDDRHLAERRPHRLERIA